MGSPQRSAVTRSTTARGPISGILSITGADACCLDVMNQLPAVQGLLEGTSRAMLRRHVETWGAKATQAGPNREDRRGADGDSKSGKHVFGPPLVHDEGELDGEQAQLG
jgi:DNA-binding FrmR family transcriptional regulator